MRDYKMLSSERHEICFHHSYNVRNSDELNFPFPRVEKHRQFVLYNAVREWNRLPHHIKNKDHFNLFMKYTLKYVKNDI